MTTEPKAPTAPTAAAKTPDAAAAAQTPDAAAAAQTPDAAAAAQTPDAAAAAQTPDAAVAAQTPDAAVAAGAPTPRLQGSIVALVTPFRDGAVCGETLKKLIAFHIEAKTDAVVLCGTTGESPTLSHDEHRRIVDLGVAYADGRLPIIAGTGSNATHEAIALTRAAAASGAAAALIVTPYYNLPSQDGLVAHFAAVFEACPDIDVIAYNIPGRSVVDMTPETMKRLAGHRRFIGVKDASDDIARIDDLRAAMGEGFLQLSGNDASILAYRASGGHGCISVSANVAPALSAQFHDLCRRGDFDGARILHRRLYPLHRALFSAPSPAPTKYALHKLGLCPPELRLPMIPPPAIAKAYVDQAMIHAGLCES